MIRTVLTLQVASGHADGLVDVFRRLKVLETSRAQDGCLSAEIAVSTDKDEAIVTATWSDEAAYERWTSRPDRGSLLDEVNPHLAAPLSAQTVGRVYRIVHRP